MKLKRTEAAVEDLRSQIHTQKPESYGFASLAAVPYAHIAARRLGGKHPKGTTITLAPNPKDIVCFHHTLVIVILTLLLVMGKHEQVSRSTNS